MNDDQLRKLLDSSFGEGPPAPLPSSRLAAGRRALRRRRLASCGASAAVLAVAITAFAVAGGGSDAGTRAIAPGAPGDVTTSSTTSPSVPPDCQPTFGHDASEPSDGAPSAPTGEEAGCPPGEAPASLRDIKPLGSGPVLLEPDGTLVTARGVEVIERIENPLGSVDPEHSLAIAFTLDGEETWALLDSTSDESTGTSSGVTSEPARKAFATLEDWVDNQVALANGDPGLSLVTFDGDDSETLVPRPGVRILEQSADVDLPRFAEPEDRSAVAMVSYEGERWFVLARDLSGTPDYIPTSGSVGGRTLAAFLDYAGAQYAGGEGLR